MKIGYVSGYTKEFNKGISSFVWEDGDIKDIQLEVNIHHPTYFDIKNNELFSIIKQEQLSGIAYFKRAGRHLKLIDTYVHQTIPSCFITVKEDTIVTCNYHLGTCCIYQINKDKIKLVKIIQEEKNSKCHHAFYFNDLLYVTYLGLDKIYIYDKAYQKIDEIKFPKNTGPRHCVLNNDKTLLYVVCELSCEVCVIDVEMKKILQVLPICKEKEGSSGAAIRISDDNKYLYTSCRGDNCIAVFKIEQNQLKLISYLETKETPRDFILFDDYLIVIHQDDNFIRIFHINEEQITFVKDVNAVKELVCIKKTM